MKESEVINKFERVISSYKFATHVQKERTIASGRIDICLPDYDVVIEAKGDGGYLKHAVGQSLVYSEELGFKPYILCPYSTLTRQILKTCENNKIGVLTVPTNHDSVKIVNNIGNLDAFTFYTTTKDFSVEEENHSSWEEVVL